MKHFGDNFLSVIPTDTLNHSQAHPFCDDPTCPCHEDATAIGQVNAWH